MANDTYLFSTGAIREVEKKLFDLNAMVRMIDAPSVDQSFKIFNELSYADELLEMVSPEQYREVLAHDLKQVVDFLRLISPNQAIIELILAYYNFYNLKKIFKAKYYNIEDVKFLYDLGTIPPEKLLEIILKQNTKITLPDEYQSLLNQALKELEQNHAAHAIDSYFDKQYFIFLYQKSLELKDNSLIKIIKYQIDVANIKIIIRSKLLNRNPEDIKDNIIPSGDINVNELGKVYSKEMTDIIKIISDNFTDRDLVKEFNTFLEHNNLWQLEKVLDNYLIKLIKEIRMKSEESAAMYAYFLAKKNAIRNIRIIIAGKINKISSKEIKESVRDLY